MRIRILLDGICDWIDEWEACGRWKSHRNDDVVKDQYRDG